MTCREITEILSDFVSGELATETATVLETHVARCPNCQVFLVQFRHTVELARVTGVEIEDPGDVPAELVEAVLTVIKAEDR
jgi:anti-sigma factor RsiW